MYPSMHRDSRRVAHHTINRGALSLVAPVLFVTGTLVLAMGCGRDSGRRETPTSPTAPSDVATFSLSCEGANVPAGLEGSVTARCTVTPIGGFTGAVAAACATTAPGLTCRTDPASLTINDVGPVAVTTSVTYEERLPFGESLLQITASGSGVTRAAALRVVKSGETLVNACPPAAAIARLHSELQITLEGDPTGGRPSDCGVAESGRALTFVEAQVYRALIAMRYLTFTEPLPWTSGTLWQWVRSSIRAIRVRTDIASSFAQGETIHLLVGSNSFLFVDGGPRLGTLAFFMGLVVHETRHTNGFPHTCRGVDDETLSEMGAWGVQYHFYRLFALHTDRTFVPVNVSEYVARTSDRGAVECRRICDGRCSPY